MKKATLTFGLFSLVVLTSFTQVSGDSGTPTTTTTTTTSDSGGGPGNVTIGGSNIGGGNKKDIISPVMPVKMEYNNNSAQVDNFRKKTDN